MIISFNSIKGGVGKSTMATTLAVWLVSRKNDVLLVDGDDQETASDFTMYREKTLKGETGYTLVNMTGANLRKQVDSMRTKYDYIIIDTGGRDTTSQRAALTIADIAVIPFVPRSFDLWTIDKVTNLVDEVNALRPAPLKVYTFLSRADLRSVDNRDVAKELGEIEQISYLPFQITNRKAISNAAGVGLAVHELEDPDKKAMKEIDDLFNYIIYGSDTTTQA